MSLGVKWPLAGLVGLTLALGACGSPDTLGGRTLCIDYQVMEPKDQAATADAWIEENQAKLPPGTDEARRALAGYLCGFAPNTATLNDALTNADAYAPKGPPPLH